MIENDPRQKALQEVWIHRMQELSAYWFHDTNPARPYAQLTGGKISNYYADCTSVVSRPLVCAEAADALLTLAPKHFHTQKIGGFVGSAYGAITLAYELTRQMGLEQAWYTAKGKERGDMLLDRFNFSPEHNTVALAEDVVTEFTTTRGTIKAILKKAVDTGVEGRILPIVFCIVNRSGLREIDGYQIISLIIEDRARNWEEGQNPFTSNGKELRPPVRPKQNWDALTRLYR
jgi:orotate phosphoribosyltransferase